MDELLERLYRRMGRRYRCSFVVLVLSAASVFTVLTVLAALGFESAARGSFLELLGLGALSSVVATTIIMIRVRRTGTFDPLFAWIDGERGPGLAVEAWRAATTRVLPFIVFG